MRLPLLSIGLGLASAALGLTSVAATAGLMVPPAGAVTSEAPPARAGLWSAAAVEGLLAEAQAAAGEGLDTGAYDVAGLRAAAAAGDVAATDRRATALALAIAGDYANGRVADRAAYDWRIAAPAADTNRLAASLGAVVAAGTVRPWLRSLLPADPRYAALRDAYARTTDAALRDRLRANLERWRWMPRDLGADHIYVNVPSYTLSLVDDGRTVSTYTVVVGAPATPTPQIGMTASAVVVNPSWTVPQSIARKGLGRGFTAVRSGGVVRYRQAPGPRNALGRVKIDMPNPYAIYLHDTPAKAVFERASRAASHGCIRVKDIDRLAAELVERDAASSAEMNRAMAGAATRTVALTERRPVWLVYFTADVDASGRLVTYEDPYGRDARLLAGMARAERLAAAQRRATVRA